MQATYYLQKLIMRKQSNDDEYLGADAEISQDIIDLISLKPELFVRQNTGRSGPYLVQLDEYELAMASWIAVLTGNIDKVEAVAELTLIFWASSKDICSVKSYLYHLAW